MMIPHGATINCSLWVHLQLNWAWSFLHVVCMFFNRNGLTLAIETKIFFGIVIVNQLGDIWHFNRKCIMWVSKLCMMEVLLQLKVSLTTVIVTGLNSFMVGKGTGLPSRNHWKWAVNNCANLIKVGMGRAKLVMIICQGNLAVGFTTAWMANCCPVNHNHQSFLSYAKM